MGDREKVHSQLEHLQAKYVGTGTRTRRSSTGGQPAPRPYALYVGMHCSACTAIAENESVGRVKSSCLQAPTLLLPPPPFLLPISHHLLTARRK